MQPLNTTQHSVLNPLVVALSGPQTAELAAGRPLYVLLEPHVQPHPEPDADDAAGDAPTVPAPITVGLGTRGGPRSRWELPILRGLTDKPLSPRTRCILERLLEARVASETIPPSGRRKSAFVSVAALAQCLVDAGLAQDLNKGEKAVHGNTRALGKRLNAKMGNQLPPTKLGTDRTGEDVADAVPLLALLHINNDDGTHAYALRSDVVDIVAAALGLGAPDAEIVQVAMSAHSAAMIDRVAASLGVTRDAAIARLTQEFGAG